MWGGRGADPTVGRGGVIVRLNGIRRPVQDAVVGTILERRCSGTTELQTGVHLGCCPLSVGPHWAGWMAIFRTAPWRNLFSSSAWEHPRRRYCSMDQEKVLGFYLPLSSPAHCTLPFGSSIHPLSTPSPSVSANCLMLRGVSGAVGTVPAWVVPLLHSPHDDTRTPLRMEIRNVAFVFALLAALGGNYPTVGAIRSIPYEHGCMHIRSSRANGTARRRTESWYIINPHRT